MNLFANISDPATLHDDTATVVATFLCEVRRRAGSEGVVEVAQALIYASTAVLAHEAGNERAQDTLVTASEVIKQL